MGYDRDGYVRHVKGAKDGFSYKIVSWQQYINKLGLDKTREVISELQRQNGKIEQEQIRGKDETIEYVVEEELDR